MNTNTPRPVISNTATILIILVICLVGLWAVWPVTKQGPWLIGCVDVQTNQQYLLKAEKKPVIKGNFIMIGDDTFITPRPMMTCRIVEEIELTPEVGSGMM